MVQWWWWTFGASLILRHAFSNQTLWSYSLFHPSAQALQTCKLLRRGAYASHWPHFVVAWPNRLVPGISPPRASHRRLPQDVAVRRVDVGWLVSMGSAWSVAGSLRGASLPHAAIRDVQLSEMRAMKAEVKQILWPQPNFRPYLVWSLVIGRSPPSFDRAINAVSGA